MKKNIINVPAGTKYLSELKNADGTAFELPNGILSKGPCGCGATTLALKDSHPTVVCSPRVLLMTNKNEQISNLFIVKKGVTKDDIAGYIQKCETEHLVPKIMTTYDSFKKVRECIDLTEYRVVIDEFQCLCNDSTFKADTEYLFLESLRDLPYVTYISATPIPEEYLSLVNALKYVPYYHLEWEEKHPVQVVRRYCDNPISVVSRIIRAYEDGNVPKYVDAEGNEVLSEEAVFFLNSVTGIVNIINNIRLEPEDVNIIVAQDDDNKDLVHQLGDAYSIGRLPLKGEHHPKYTFCTKTAYFGSDFYSTNACTFVISDCRQPNTAVDISTELTQIAGRQRLEENPFRYLMFFIYKVSRNDCDEAEFMKQIEDKTQLTNEQIESFNSAGPMYRSHLIKTVTERRSVLDYKYTDTYTMYDESADRFVFNELERTAEMWAWDAQCKQYQCGNLVDQELSDTGVFTLLGRSCFAYIPNFFQKKLTKKAFKERMMKYIELVESTSCLFHAVARNLSQDNPELKIYYDSLGKETIEQLDYNEYKIKEAYSEVQHSSDISDALHDIFEDGSKYTSTEIKDQFKNVLSQFDASTSCTAKGIQDYGFSLTETKVYRDGRRVGAYLVHDTRQLEDNGKE